MRKKGETALDSLKQELDSLGLEYLNGDTPPKLFHYTNTQGLLGILDSQYLWATHVSYLNDATEIRYTYELVEEISEDLIAQEDRDKETTSDRDDPLFIYRTFLYRLSYKTARPKPKSDIYVACFCEEDDLLSQWRGYGSMGSGYAIGFDTNRLNHPRDSIRLRKVEYSRDEQKQILHKILEVVGDSLKRVTKGMTYDTARPHADSHALIFEEEVVKYAAFFKHPTFREEQEWRLIYFPTENSYSSQIKFRSGSLGIIPYTQISLPDGKNNDQEGILPIASMRIGPTANPALAKKALEMVAHSKYPNLEITASDVPLR